MYSIELMVEEHENILKLLKVIQNACCGILEGEELLDEDFRKMISFAREYADKHHHGKEEQILFQQMTEHLGPIGVNLIQHGMLVEHDLGRLHISELEKALNQYREEPQTIYKLHALTEAMGYANLLQRHIDKENQAVYSYAEKSLLPDVLKSVDERVRLFEAKANENHVQETHLRALDELLEKYSAET